MTTGEKIKLARQKAGLTQRDLALRMDVTASTVGQYETGIRNPKTSTLLKFAKAIGCAISDLLPDSEDIVFSADPKTQLELYRAWLNEQIKIANVKPPVKIKIESLPNLEYVFDPTYFEAIAKNGICEPAERNQLAMMCLYFEKLNETGRKAAIERIEELTMIPKFTESEEAPNGVNTKEND